MTKKQLIWFCAILLIIGAFFGSYKFLRVKRVVSVSPDSKIEFKPQPVPSGNSSSYNIKLDMNPDGLFHIESTVKIKNTSKDTWNELVFYFISNMFTKDNSPHLKHPSNVRFNHVKLNGEQVNFSLNNDTLKVTVHNKILPNTDSTVNFSYDLSLPEGGVRLTNNNGNYFLAQFYPMLATYRNHKWNKEKYLHKGETYHTAFSDFTVNYKVPKGYTVASTSQDDIFPSKNVGAFHISNVKEIFIAILKDPKIVQVNNKNVSIRIFDINHDGTDNNEELYKEIANEALDALNFFQAKIGPYPFKQLDIVLGEMGMEYPGIITAGSIYNSATASPQALKNMVIHEIAHQWFYGVISNDPFNDAWLDEGFANFAESLYLYTKSKKPVPYKQIAENVSQLNPELPINLPLDKYPSQSSKYIYGKSLAMLWGLFENRDGIKGAEKFLKTYYQLYKYKEINTHEFVRFAKSYFSLSDNLEFQEWIKLN